MQFFDAQKAETKELGNTDHQSWGDPPTWQICNKSKCLGKILSFILASDDLGIKDLNFHGLDVHSRQT